MEYLNIATVKTGSIAVCSLVALFAAALPVAAQTSPVAKPPYTIKVFAKGPAGTSQPDSIVQWGDHIIVGFENGVAKDGSDGKSSTIVQFSLSGKVERTFRVPGHNDGLRVVGEDDLWAVQNEDANPNLVVIQLHSGTKKQYNFPPTPHGGGYDDIVVKNGEVFMTASNPNLDAMGNNVFPALVRTSLSGSSVLVEPVLDANASATDISTGTDVKLNLTDPDSMTIDPRGNIVLDSQADSELVFIRNPFTAEQRVGLLKLSSPITGPMNATITVDDTAFAPNPKAFLLITDVQAGLIYRVDSGTFGFEPGAAYSASDTLGLLGTLNLDNGALTPAITGFGSPRGLIFVSPDADRDGDDK
jgi:hypothetical protein